MVQIFRLRYALVSLLLIAFLGIAGSSILCSDMANAAEEKQVSKKKKQVNHLKIERKKNVKPKAAKKKSWFFDFCWCDDCSC
jgi:hypothetical protein